MAPGFVLVKRAGTAFIFLHLYKDGATLGCKPGGSVQPCFANALLKVATPGEFAELLVNRDMGFLPTLEALSRTQGVGA